MNRTKNKYLEDSQYTINFKIVMFRDLLITSFNKTEFLKF